MAAQVLIHSDKEEESDLGFRIRQTRACVLALPLGNLNYII